MRSPDPPDADTMLAMLGITLGLLLTLAGSPAAKAEPSAHLRKLATTCQARRGIAAEAFVHHLQGAARGRVGWSVVLQGADAKTRGAVAKKIALAAGAELTRVDETRLAGKTPADAKKNLDELFTKARTGNGILFFDEADALFGRRSEVADSHDRYANLEVSYLLERVIAHGDLVLLGTRKAPPSRGATKPLRDVVVAIQPKGHRSVEQQPETAVPWTALCWPPR